MRVREQLDEEVFPQRLPQNCSHRLSPVHLSRTRLRDLVILSGVSGPNRDPSATCGSNESETETDRGRWWGRASGLRNDDARYLGGSWGGVGYKDEENAQATVQLVPQL